jgi:hypothetical protein
MYFGYAFAGLIVGIFVAGSDSLWLLSALGGIAIGVLLARIVELGRRVKALESSARRNGVTATDRSAPPIVRAQAIQTTAAGEQTHPWFDKDPDDRRRQGSPYESTDSQALGV